MRLDGLVRLFHLRLDGVIDGKHVFKIPSLCRMKEALVHVTLGVPRVCACQVCIGFQRGLDAMLPTSLEPWCDIHPVPGEVGVVVPWEQIRLPNRAIDKGYGGLHDLGVDQDGCIDDGFRLRLERVEMGLNMRGILSLDDRVAKRVFVGELEWGKDVWFQHCGSVSNERPAC